MTRRGLLSFFVRSAATAAVVDPEQLLWVPGQKMISIPTMIRPVPVVPIIPASDLLQLMIERVRPRLLEMFEQNQRIDKLIRTKHA